MTDAPPELTPDDRLARSDGWWLVRRLPDANWPSAWERLPIAAWTLGPTHDGARTTLIAVLGDGTTAPLRPAVEGRDGADRHERGDALHPCLCASPTTWISDPEWCTCCAGLVPGGGRG